MKRFSFALLFFGAGLVAGAFYLKLRQPSPPAQAASVVAASPVPAPPDSVPAQSPVSSQPAPAAAPQPAQSSAPFPQAADSKPADSTNAVPLKPAIDALLSRDTPFEQKQALWKQLKDAGELDQAVAELKARALADPNDAAIPAALGQAYLHEFPVADPNEQAILGLEVDQSFNTALKLDPSNWEAQFFKASAMSYWPPDMNKGQEVVQRFSNLIDQQDSIAPQPQFAQTYLLLGNQYQKMGMSDYASQTWKLGAQKFPADPGLQAKLAGLSN